MRKRRINSADVALEAGVSRTTVSMVLNKNPNVQISDETRKRVFAAVERLGYVPDASAQALASRRSNSIGLVMVRQPYHVVADAFLNMMLAGFFESVHRNDMRFLIDIVEPQHQKQTYLNLVRAKHIDGIILAGPPLDDPAVFELEANQFPTVMIGRMKGEFSWVDIDNRTAAVTAVEHLIKLGHRQIACITNSSPDYGAPADRLTGYRDALESAGIPFDQALVRFGDFDLASGYARMNDLLAQGHPFSAVFVSSDVVAQGAVSALLEHGQRVPEDVAVVGFDDVPYACYANPPLTTIRVPARQMAEQACEMLIGMISSDNLAPRTFQLPTELVVRESCGAALQKPIATHPNLP